MAKFIPGTGSHVANSRSSREEVLRRSRERGSGGGSSQSENRGLEARDREPGTRVQAAAGIREIFAKMPATVKVVLRGLIVLWRCRNRCNDATFKRPNFFVLITKSPREIDTPNGS